MGLRINTNLQALTAHKNLTKTDASLGQSLERLSSGLRINKAADDASGLAIADNLRAQHTGIAQAIANANDGVNIIQIADGALEESLNIVTTIRTKAIQAASDAQSVASRKAIQADVSKLLEELQMIGETTAYNGLALLDGTFINKSFHVGAYKDETVGVSVEDARATRIGAMAYAKTNRDPVAAVSNPFMRGGRVSSAALNDADLRMNSIQIGASVTQMTTYADTDSAWAKASAINAKVNESGVQAKATTEVIVGVAGALSGVAINGVTVNNLGIDNATELISFVNNNTTLKAAGIRAEGIGTSEVKIVAEDGRNLVFGIVAADYATDTLVVNGVSVGDANATITQRGTLTLSNARSMVGGEAVIAAGTVNAGDLVINGVDVAGGGALTVIAGDTDRTLVTAINNNKELQALGIRGELFREAGDTANVYRLRLISESEPITISGVDPGRTAKLVPGTREGIKTTGVLVEGAATDSNPTDNFLSKIGMDGARFGTKELDGASNTGGNDISVVNRSYITGHKVNATAFAAGDLYVNGIQIGASVAQAGGYTLADPNSVWTTDPVVSGTLTDPTRIGTYTFTVSGTAAIGGGTAIGIDWVDPYGASGTIVIPGAYAGGPLAGPNGLQFDFNPTEPVVNGEIFTVTVSETIDNTTAFAKAAAINDKINETGVAAKATTEVLLGVNGALSGIAINGIFLDGLGINTAAEFISFVNNNINLKGASIRAEDFNGEVRLIADDGRNIALNVIAANYPAAGRLTVNGVSVQDVNASLVQRGTLTLSNARAMVNGLTGITAGTINEGELIINGVDVAAGGGLSVQTGDSDRTLVNAINNNATLQKMGIRAELYKAAGDTNFRLRIISERDPLVIGGTDPGKTGKFVPGKTEGSTSTQLKVSGALVDSSPTKDNYLEMLGFSGLHYGTTEESGIFNNAGNDVMFFGVDKLSYNSGDVSINGYKIGQPVDDGISHAKGDRSAAAWAAVVNLVKDQTGVEADIIKATVTGAGMIQEGVLHQADLVINGIDIVRDNTGGNGMKILAGDAEHALVKAINEYKDQTGVIASIDKDNKLVLTAIDGRNIHVQSTAAGNKFIKLEADFGPGKGIAQDSVFMGSIRLVSDSLFKADGAGSSAAARELSLLKMGLAGGGSKTEATSDLKGDGTFIAGINYDTAISKADVTTQEGAEMVIRSADYAITRLDSIRSGLGSVQNQLTSTVANLSVTKINVQSTESTIRDVDFAQESSVFSKMQVLMQAGTYAQSQANASAQNVMKLLQ